MSKFTERLSVYNEALKPICRSKNRRLIELPGKVKIYVSEGPVNLSGKACVYKVELGDTQDFGIISTSTPFSRAVSLGYCSKTIKSYGGKAYLKLLNVFDDVTSAKVYAEDLRKDLEVTRKEFRRL